RRLSVLFPRRRDRRHHRRATDGDLPFGLFLRPEARALRHPAQGTPRAFRPGGRRTMNDTLALALMPFQLAFMQNAFLVTLTIAVPMALLSCYLVLKGWSLMGDAVSHAVLPGVVIAYMIGLPLAIGAFVAGLVCALAAGYLKDNSRVKED